MAEKVTSALVDAFLQEQLAEWEQARNNFAALSGVKVKEIDIDGMTVKVQFNPARIVSSAAKVDAKSLKERKCFLCAANRPAVQRGIEWGGHYRVTLQSLITIMWTNLSADVLQIWCRLQETSKVTPFSIMDQSAVLPLRTTCTSKQEIPTSLL